MRLRNRVMTISVNHTQQLAALCITLLLSGCKGPSLPIPFVSKPTSKTTVSKPTSMIIEIDTAGDINPTSSGRASPLSLRLYQLKSSSVFDKADFLALYDADERTLGGDLVHKEEITLKPNEKRIRAFEPTEETHAIGMFAAFRDYERAQWRAVAAVQQHKSNVILVSVSGTSLTIR